MSGEAASEPSEALRALGPPPEDLRRSPEYAYRLLMLQAHEAALDPNISEATRRREVRVIMRDAQKLYPDSLRQEAAAEIRQSRAKLDSRRAQKTSARLEPVGGGAKVIQIRGDRG